MGTSVNMNAPCTVCPKIFGGAARVAGPGSNARRASLWFAARVAIVASPRYVSGYVNSYPFSGL